MKRLLTALLAGAAVFSIAFASAAALDVDGNTIQAGTDADLACDDDGVTVDWGLETSPAAVHNLSVENISTDCVTTPATELFARVYDASDNLIQAFSADITGTTVVFTFNPADRPTPEEISKLELFIEG